MPVSESLRRIILNFDSSRNRSKQIMVGLGHVNKRSNVIRQIFQIFRMVACIKQFCFNCGC